MSPPDFAKPVQLIDWLEKRTYLAWLVLVISGAAVAALKYFFPKDSGQEAAAILFSILLIIAAVTLLFNFGDKQHGKFVRLRRLAKDEQTVAQRFVKEECATCNFSAGTNGIWSLVGKRILIVHDHLTPDAGDGGVLVCEMKLWAFRYLNKHHKLVGLPVSTQSAVHK